MSSAGDLTIRYDVKVDQAIKNLDRMQHRVGKHSTTVGRDIESQTNKMSGFVGLAMTGMAASTAIYGKAMGNSVNEMRKAINTSAHFDTELYRSTSALKDNEDQFYRLKRAMEEVEKSTFRDEYQYNKLSESMEENSDMFAELLAQKEEYEKRSESQSNASEEAAQKEVVSNKKVALALGLTAAAAAGVVGGMYSVVKASSYAEVYSSRFGAVSQQAANWAMEWTGMVTVMDDFGDSCQTAVDNLEKLEKGDYGGVLKVGYEVYVEGIEYATDVDGESSLLRKLLGQVAMVVVGGPVLAAQGGKTLFDWMIDVDDTSSATDKLKNNLLMVTAGLPAVAGKMVYEKIWGQEKLAAEGGDFAMGWGIDPNNIKETEKQAEEIAKLQPEATQYEIEHSKAATLTKQLDLATKTYNIYNDAYMKIPESMRDSGDKTLITMRSTIDRLSKMVADANLALKITAGNGTPEGMKSVGWMDYVHYKLPKTRATWDKQLAEATFGIGPYYIPEDSEYTPPKTKTGGGTYPGNHFGGPIKETGLNLLHAGEFVVPKAGALMSGSGGGGDTYNISPNINITSGSGADTNGISREISIAIADEIRRMTTV